MSRRRKIIIGVVVLGIVGFLVMQVFPLGSLRPVYERHPNPPVLVNIQWSSPEVAGLVKRACYDCHSNETNYPWYSNIAPVSWLITRDINVGRAVMNFSEDAGTEYSLADM